MTYVVLFKAINVKSFEKVQWYNVMQLKFCFVNCSMYKFVYQFMILKEKNATVIRAEEEVFMYKVLTICIEKKS